jgi:hypothetical protein
MGLVVTSYKRDFTGYYYGDLLDVKTNEKSIFFDAYRLDMDAPELAKYLPVYNPKNVEGVVYNPNEKTYYFLKLSNDEQNNEMLIKTIYYFDTKQGDDKIFKLEKQFLDNIVVPDNWCPKSDPIYRSDRCMTLVSATNIRLRILLSNILLFINNNSDKIGLIIVLIIIYILYVGKK